MARSSGHISYVMAILMTVLCLYLATDMTHARSPVTYFVGDKDGWGVTIPMDSWAQGKTFYAGDILVFKYDYQDGNLWVVNSTGYETCTANEGAKLYESGYEKIQLPCGFSYYIGIYDPADCSAGTSSPSPPPTPPSRPPFRPAGIAQPSKPETKSKLSPSLSRAKSNVAAIIASLSGSQSPSRGVATPTRLANQQSGSPLKKPESLKTEEQKVTMKEKPNPVIKKPPISRLEQKEAEEAQEQRKKKEAEKRDAQEKKKVLLKDMERKSETSQGQHKITETESNQQPGSPIKRPESIRTEEQKAIMNEKLEREAGKNINPVIEKPPIVRSDRKEGEAAQEQRKKTELEKLAEQERKKVQGQQKKIETGNLAVQETKRDLQAASKEDATRSRTTRHITAASDLSERKTQNRTEIHSGDNHQKAKGVATGNPRDMIGEGTSSMSKRIKEDVRDGVSKLTWGKSNGDEKTVSVYTLTGENRGATMAIASDKDKKDGEVHIRRGYKSNPNESPNTSTTETEGETSKGKTPKENEDEEEARFRAYVNGNTQGINNSIVLESSVRENDPGIHMSIKFEETKKEVTIPPEKKPEKLKNETRVRRRCLRGLLAESSESENPLKPRKHGCRFKCKDKDIENT
ncbi:hypothetical protein AALP_AA2G194700 [Arabis alpina]|uniref:Phytocyanin domain-containing protein n=1 Tax=Arabis alpina TaxID=50452 RepID=A0A087HIL1_ARAAL|nr:hypothetical protein AALP_AA2G194700 [Arabis alpina]